MTRPTDSNEQLLCSFCGKSQRQVKKLIAGPGVYICDECIDLCNEIIDEELAAAPTFDVDSLPTKRRSRVGTEFDYDRSHGVRCTERELCSFKSLQCEVGRDLTRHGLGLGEFVEPSILSRKTRRNH